MDYIIDLQLINNDFFDSYGIFNEFSLNIFYLLNTMRG